MFFLADQTGKGGGEGGEVRTAGQTWSSELTTAK